MTVTESPDKPPPRLPTSREINQALTVLHRAEADPEALRLLDVWNTRRLVIRAIEASTNEELRNLFTGVLRPNPDFSE